MASTETKLRKPVPIPLGFGLSLLLFLIGIELPILLRWSRHCFNNWDLGIYAQAILRIRPLDLNPWLSVRQIHLFNDHFDPIFILVSPFAKILNPSLALVLIELSAVLASALAFYFLYRKGKLPYRNALLGWILVLFSSGTLKALFFTSHPTTWTIFPLTLLALTTGLQNSQDRGTQGESLGRIDWKLIGLCTFLFLFKEEYLFCGWMLGVVLLALNGGQQRRTGLVLLFLTGLSTLGVFWLRPLLLGPVENYGAFLFSPWWKGPFQQLKLALVNRGVWQGWIENFLPFLPLIFWTQKSKGKWSWNWIFFFAVLPLWMIRFFGIRWSQHYGIALCIGILGTLLGKTFFRQEVTRKVLWSTLSLLFLVNLSLVGKFSGRTFRDRVQSCPAHPERLKEIDAAFSFLKNSKDSTPVYAMGNLIPHYVELSDLRHLGYPFPSSSLSGVSETSRRIWVFEKGPVTGDPWPISRESIQDQLSQAEKLGKAFKILKPSWGKWIEVWELDL